MRANGAYGEEARGGKGLGVLLGGRACFGPFVLGVFNLFLQAESLGEVSGGHPNRIFISYPGLPFQGHGLY